MSSKPSAANPTASATSFQRPPQVHLSDKLLASSITLPPDAVVISTTFVPTPGSLHQPHNLEIARQNVLARNGHSSLLESLLTNVKIGKQSAIRIFSIAAPSRLPEMLANMKDLQFEGLDPSDPVTFTPQDVYLASHASQSSSGSYTVNIANQDAPFSSTSSPTRKALRTLYCQFIDAIRNHLIEDIVNASNKPKFSSDRKVLRLRDGILLSHPTRPCEWGTEWEHHAQARSLIHCSFQISLLPWSDSQARLVIHPLLSPTSHLLLGPLLPMPPGTPMTLLPSGTPAYYLAIYTGPTSGLVRQFNASFVGHGVNGWDREITASRTNNSEGGRLHGKSSVGHDASRIPQGFVIAWVSVENKQGEEKGVTIIWPTSLCVTFVSSALSNGDGLKASARRRLLNYIPELPSELQPSPPPARATSAVSESGVGSGILSPSLPLPSGALTPSITGLSPTVDALQHSGANASDTTSASAYRLYPSLVSSPTSDSLRAFRSLTVSRSKNIPQVASEVGEYVDFVARERERERDRIRKERENLSSPRQSRGTPNTPAPTAGIPPVSGTPTPSSAASAEPPTLLQTASAAEGGLDSLTGHSHPQLSNENFYPSPPHTNPPVPLLAVMESSSTAVSDNELPVGQQPLEMRTVSAGPAPASSFNSFGNLDMSWSEPVQSNDDDFLEMDIDFGTSMGFGMDINAEPVSAASGTARDYRRVDIDFEEAFTEDDFSYFDSKPSRPSGASPPCILPSVASAALDPFASSGLAPTGGSATAGIGWSPTLFGEPSFSGPGPPQQSPTAKPFGTHASHWADGLTPKFGEAEVTPALSPPSLGQSPLSNGGPPTPNVQLDESVSRSYGVSAKRNLFDPIPFAGSHKLADGKYMVGKFAWTSDVDGTQGIEDCEIPPRGWKSIYVEATDPRIGLVRKLIGVKRKSISQHGTGRPSNATSAWSREHEDWSTKYDSEVEDSDVESEDGDVEETDSPQVTRPSTPPPSYLPLGHTLLHTQFHHSQLLPLSSPLRPPSAVVAPTNISAGPVPTFVPTPVSPAAALGAANEKSKSLEAAALMVAREVVENYVWTDAWFANALASAQRAETWHSDLNFVARLLSEIPLLEGPLELLDLFALASNSSETSPDTDLQLLESPFVSVSKGDAIVQVMPTAMRFWEKLGLGPKGGTKDVTAYVLFEEVDESHTLSVESWLRNVSVAYHDKHLGSHTPGRGGGSENGLLPLRFDSSFRKSLANIVANLPLVGHSLVFYVIMPVMVMTLSSQLCRQVLSAIKKALKTYSEAQVLFHLIPEQLIYGTLDDPAARYTVTESICASVYNRLLRPVDRIMSRKFSDHGQRIRAYFHDNAITLARSSIHAKYSMSHCFDVMDRHTLLHVGYQISPCGKWILAACIDERGEAHDVGVWLTQTQGEDASHGENIEVTEMLPEVYVASKVWCFALEFAKRANVEWRIAITKLGTLRENELQAWTSYLAKATDGYTNVPYANVSLLCVDTDASWRFIPPRVMSPVKKSRLSRGANSPLYVDISANTYALYPHTVFPLTPPQPQSDSSMVTESSRDEADRDMLPVFPLLTSILIRVPAEGGHALSSMLQLHLFYASPLGGVEGDVKEQCRRERDLIEDITRNFVELAILAKTRWLRQFNPILPYHLAAVEVMNRALTRDEDQDDFLGCDL